MTNNFDIFFSKRIGGFGKWHFMFIFTIVTATTLPIEFFSQFAFLLPEYHCQQSALTSWSKADIINLTIPLKSKSKDTTMNSQTFEGCEEYDLDSMWGYVDENATLSELLILRQNLFHNLTRRKCQHGVSFDNKKATTFAVEFQLICERRYLIPLSNTAYFLGMLIGFVISGPLSEKYGRRIVCIICPFFYTVSGVGTAFANNIWLFITLRLITGVTITIAYLTALLLVSEWVNIHQRNVFGFYRKLHFGLISRGFLALSFYVMPSWRYAYAIYFIQTLPVFIGFLLWLESPRWLLSEGRLEEAEASIISVIQWNGGSLDDSHKLEIREELISIAASIQPRDDEYKSVKLSEDAEPENEKAKSRFPIVHDMYLLFGSAKLRKTLLIWLCLWIISAFLFIGIQFNAVRLGSDPYLIAVFSSLMAIPGNLLQYTAFRFFDRKWPFTVFFGASSVILFIAFLLTFSGVHGWPVVTACTIGLILVEGLFTMHFIRTPEVFPTNVRSISFGLCAAASRIGMAIASYVERLDEIWVPLPILVFCIGSTFATIVSTFLAPGKGTMEEWSEDSDASNNEGPEAENESNVV